MANLANYSKDIQESVNEILGTYGACYVLRENGEYSVTTAIMVKANYAEDYQVDTFLQKDVLTPDEKILAYTNNFYDYHREYNGERNYRMLDRAFEAGNQFKFDESGNIVEVTRVNNKVQ